MMNTTNLAKDAGVSRATIWNWRNAGLLPEPERRGKELLYGRAAILAARSLAEAGR